MKKTIFATAFVVIVLQFFWDWCYIAPVCFILGYWLTEGIKKSFLAAGLTTAAIWTVFTLFIYIQNDGLISSKVAVMLGLSSSMGWLLIPITALVGFIVSGLAAATGAALKEWRSTVALSK